MRRTDARANFLPKILAMAVLFLATASVTPSFSQSLGELAQKEKARREREKKGGAAKVFTEDDLQKSEKPKTETSAASVETLTPAPPGTPATPRRESSDEPSGPNSGDSGGDGGREVGGVSESAWKARAAGARGTLKSVEQQTAAADAEVERLKQDLNPMSTTFSNDPYVTLRLQGQLTEAQAKAAAAREALKAAKEEYAAFENEARRAGVPSGWLTE